MSDCLIGFFSGICLFMLLEPLVVNLVYFSNVDLFFDIICTKKNKDKIKQYFIKEK